MKLKMEVIPGSYQLEDEVFPFCRTKITIHEVNTSEPFWEAEMTALDYWSIEDYERQWREGLERIKTHDTSCLVASIQDPSKRRFLLWWTLYKKENKVFIYQELMVTESYRRRIGKKRVTPDNCYDFIRPHRVDTGEREDGYEVSEWIVDLE